MVAGFIAGVVFSFVVSTIAVIVIAINHGISFEEESE